MPLHIKQKYFNIKHQKNYTPHLSLAKSLLTSRNQLPVTYNNLNAMRTSPKILCRCMLYRALRSPGNRVGGNLAPIIILTSGAGFLF